jgi:hypothetical protein
VVTEEGVCLVIGVACALIVGDPAALAVGLVAYVLAKVAL